MNRESGSISINTENIFPIIKKWLYSDKDIFIRELVSNSSDAISKLKKLVSIGEAEVEDGTVYQIKVVVDKDNKTIKVIDNGIGMTGEEVKKYINQIAFSGAKDFIEKYKDKTDEGQIIGHFGLGFYSAFMVSDKVQIDTLSYQKGAEAVRWTSTGGTEYELEASDRTERGTTVTLYVAEDSQEFLDQWKMREILQKYFSFLPYELYIEDAASEKEEAKSEDKGKDDGESKKREPKPINDTSPLWLKNPRDCTEDEYKEFYRKVFHDFEDPLFWIHLNMDYPFNLKGILYFPKLKHEFETMEGQIKLYYNQVFVADNIKEIIPEFLMLLKGTIDCPDLPLNVSRSFLQNDGYVKKISAHITKKVADKLVSLFENERDNYNKYWDDINPFVKYGCMREEKFFERVKDIIIFKTTNGDYVTLKDYLERNKEKHENKVFYTNDENQQAQYIRLFKEQGIEVAILPSMIDSHFIQFMEIKESGIKFTRVDSDLSDSMKEDGAVVDKDIQDKLEKLFKDNLSNDKLNIKVEALKAESIPGMILASEHSRRMQEMSRMFGGADMSHMFPKEETLVLNRNNSLIKAVVKLMDREDKKEDVKLICEQVYDLSMMGHRQLEPEAMAKFIERSSTILAKLAEMSA
ncbi:molecular chaperone HtpG [Clostridium thermosuccinogenes]|jgi:molecular chaperone HtpG|uniref:Molecular chaperone HtpG n=1 Tax=Clostridium thermosuccinogenes TaxID=84032 RepID=A0A2K2F3V6_9CLOT|nr:molecular chaperone HtpG [Pseudoclostridium thermosuccinogenes]AUS95830.1 molecular chaperone HtpG [Pseudoclostridium thermosuccinogenes]PNT93453.1 molecular chaperone HtpG [Pseudoclostridium thermosuccinogenes]PNT98345.1 molecular chaperone HtpG [Pseudoclostridium thermosuccinogenes]PNU00446.1 molecular chaperone HtpG [Pseudoclostridium thermosuccinogenes]